jgi:DNA-binding PadR family transcriptional regulator
MSLKGLEARVIRGRILKILDTSYPDEISDELLKLVLDEVNMSISPAVLRGHIDYLEDNEKGYVESRVVESEELGITRLMVKLTAKGKDLLEGSIPPDPGVKL